MKALGFVIEDRSGVKVLDWSKCGGSGCRPATESEVTMYTELRRLAEVNAELLGALEKARSEFDKLPHSLGYDFDHIPAIDAVIAKAKEQQ